MVAISEGILLLALLGTVSGSAIKDEELPTTEASDIETTVTLTEFEEDIPIENFEPSDWISPEKLWSSLNFPSVPSQEESVLLSTLEFPDPEPVDIASYNLTLLDGIVDGSLPCHCGKPSGRITNGKHARINNIPWTSALAYKNAEQPFCGATLINNRYLLTAGHCVRSTKPGQIQVWLNDENYLLSNETVGGRLVYDVIEIKKHPQYKAYYNDIALLKVNDTINLGSPKDFALVNPVCLSADTENTYAGYVGTVAGWGRTSPGGSVSSALLKIKVPIWSNEDCRAKSKYGNSIKDNMMCAGFEEGVTDACQGDSGGPLIIRKNVKELEFKDDDTEGTAIIVGIVSWGFGCAENNAPGVYTRLSLYTKWILENTSDAQYCQVYYSKQK